MQRAYVGGCCVLARWFVGSSVLLLDQRHTGRSRVMMASGGAGSASNFGEQEEKEKNHPQDSFASRRYTYVRKTRHWMLAPLSLHLTGRPFSFFPTLCVIPCTLYLPVVLYAVPGSVLHTYVVGLPVYYHVLLLLLRFFFLTSDR